MSKTRTYQIAEQNIQITSVHDMVHEHCKEYLILDDVPIKKSIQVVTSQENIDFERKRSEQEDIREGLPIHNWSDAYLEELAVYRIIAEQMPERDVVLVHGSAVCVDGKAYLFTAKSGTGKSTHVKLWQELLGDRVTVINDDKPLIRLTDKQAVIYGTPYNGKHRSGSNISAPLKAISLLEQADHNYIKQITKEEAFPLLLQQAYRSENPETMSKIVSLLAKLTTFVSFWKMGCNMDISAARMAFDVMSGKNPEGQ